MVYDVLQKFIDDVSDKKIKLTEKQSSFLKALLALPEGERNALLYSMGDERKAYEKICEIGQEESLIEIAEMYMGYPYIDISKLERKSSIDNLARSATLAGMGIFSTIVDEQVVFVISNKDQVNAIKDNCDVTDFKVYICWPWDIYEKNKSLNLVIQNVSGVKRHIIMATGQSQIDAVVGYFSGVIVDKTVEQRTELFDACNTFYPDILIVSDNIGGYDDLIRILIKIKASLPKIRIIYFASELAPRDDVRKVQINSLIDLGVYDIIFDNKFSLESLKYLISTPKTRTDVKDLIIKAKKTNKKLSNAGIVVVDPSDNAPSGLHSEKNVYSFISSKGGTGKSFIVGNIAKAIGQRGVNTDNGKPNVAVIDGDFFGGGISNMFNVTDKKKNFLAAIDEAASLFTGDKITADIPTRAIVLEKIKDCFVPLPDCKNIRVLGASPNQLSDEEFARIKGPYIQFIIESILNDFDVVLIDITGDFELKIWYPIFTLSRCVFSVFDMEFNSVSNCIKQEGIIEDFVENKKKIQYMINKVVTDSRVLWGMNNIKEMEQFDIVAKIPYVNRIKMLNDSFQGKWIVDDTSGLYEDVKLEIYRAAQNCWPIKDFEKVEKVTEKKLKPKKDEKSVKDILKDSFKLLFPFAEDADKNLKKKEEVPNEIDYVEEKEEIKEDGDTNA